MIQLLFLSMYYGLMYSQKFILILILLTWVHFNHVRLERFIRIPMYFLKMKIFVISSFFYLNQNFNISFLKVHDKNKHFERDKNGKSKYLFWEYGD